MEDIKFALLIDSDNISADYIKIILDELSKYGTVTYKRIYGDWTRSNSSKWKDVLLANSINPVQQYSYTTGKNATDSAMIIDAMDILYSGHVKMCIRDRLCSRIAICNLCLQCDLPVFSGKDKGNLIISSHTTY